MKETQTPEQILAAAEAAQKQFEEQENLRIEGHLRNREKAIADEKKLFEKAGELEKMKSTASARIKDVKEKGGKVVPQLEEVEKDLDQAHKDTVELGNEKFAQIKEMENDESVISRLYDEAKKEDQHFEFKKGQEKRIKKEKEEAEVKLQELIKFKEEYDLLEEKLLEHSEKIKKLREEDQKWRKDFLGDYRSFFERNLSPKEVGEMREAGIVFEDLTKYVLSDAFKKIRNQIGIKQKEAGIIQFTLKGGLKKLDQWIDKQMVVIGNRELANNENEKFYSDILAQIRGKQKEISLKVVNGGYIRYIPQKPEFRELEIWTTRKLQYYSAIF